MSQLPLVDPEIAAATLEAHLDRFWAAGRPDQLGMSRTRIGPLEWIVGLRAQRTTGDFDRYYVRLDGRYYDPYPVEVRFVEPAPDEDEAAWSWPDAPPNGPWWPTLAQQPGWFGLHPTYNFADEQVVGQLVCFSFTAGFYRSSHFPQEHERWRQGRHTVAATLTRLQEVLHPPYYAQPAVPQPR